ncbi:MAG: ClbS/DfsB family four-helix bundle protein [Chloroflexi bacterium]|nr:ClbS/DfsB family four-helix bundle protein [Chloroflexota bacterium]
MARPKSKDELLQDIHDRYAALHKELDKLSPQQMIDPGVVGEWSVKDVLAHLFAWQQMCLGWYRTGLAGETPKTPTEKYTWRQTPELNQEIYETYRAHPLADVQRDFEASHRETVTLIEGISNADLFNKKVYAWPKSTTLGSYFISATCSHYDWARKEIRKGMKAKAAAQS